VCTTSGLAFGKPRRSGHFRRKKKRVSTQEKSDFPSVQRKQKRDLTCFYILILEIRKQNEFSSARRLLSRRSKCVPQIVSATEIG